MASRLPPHVTAQLDPAIDGVADALNALHAALSGLGGAARADLDPDTADKAFLASVAAAAHAAFGSEADAALTLGHFSGVCAQARGILDERQQRDA